MHSAQGEKHIQKSEKDHKECFVWSIQIWEAGKVAGKEANKVSRGQTCRVL